MAKHAESQGLKPPEDESIVCSSCIVCIGTTTHVTTDVAVPVIVTRRGYRTVITNYGHQVTTFHEPR